MSMQCYFFLLLSNIQKLNKILLKCFDFGFYENILCRSMHACMVAMMMVFLNANNKPVENS